MKKLIFEDLHAPSSKPELWLQHDEQTLANLRRNRDQIGGMQRKTKIIGGFEAYLSRSIKGTSWTLSLV